MKTGVWLIGARGSIAAVTVAGHAAMVAGEAAARGLVTTRSAFESAGLCALEGLVFGGHEIQAGPLAPIADAILRGCSVPGLSSATRAAVEAYDARVRRGIVRGSGAQIEASPQDAVQVDSDQAAIDHIRADLDAFKAEVGVDRLVMINLASTEPVADPQASWTSLDMLESALANRESRLPASSLYAFAALSGGDGYINFTPSTGTNIPALAELAERSGAVHMGQDGKTGETLVKSVLAELFARRNLPILSWFGQNILGNGDGQVLDDPANKASKIKTKDQLLPKILGYAPESRVGIDYVRSLGEWKIAWDHIHFEGFLGGHMSMEFTWRGVDSLLAAPLVLDLARLADLAQRRGEVGLIGSLAAFFKDPLGTDEQRLISQDERLLRWVCQDGG